MASLTWTTVSSTRKEIIKNQMCQFSQIPKVQRQPQIISFRRRLFKHLPLLCSKPLPWEASPKVETTENGDNIMKGRNIVEAIYAEGSTDLPVFQSEESKGSVIDKKKQIDLVQRTLKFPVWILGPAVLLATGMVPTLWLPLSSVFLGPDVAGLLSLVGLDCLFNMGATLFLLMADSCGSPNDSSSGRKSHVPLTYKLWSLGSSLLGLLVPLFLLFASERGYLQPTLSFISFAVLLGPYLLLLSVQMLTEILTWHWKSPVWLVAPVVYEAYRVLQLMRGLSLANEINAPTWMVQSLRGLVTWWVLVLGIQLMRVAWFAGFAASQKES